MRKPNRTRIDDEIRSLRLFVEDGSNDKLERRLAQVAEDALLWATENTTWSGPLSDLSGMARIIRGDGVDTPEDGE